MHKKLIKWWLTGILIFLPFQDRIIKIIKFYNIELSAFFGRVDEYTIGMFFPLALIEFYRNKGTMRRSFVVLLLSVFAVGCCGLISGAVNDNPLLATIHGSIDYIKYFFVIFIYAAFFREQDEFNKVFRLLLITTVIIGSIAFIQEIWAIYSRYILKKDIQDIFYININNFLGKDTKPVVLANTWRFGMFRVSSLMMNFNYLGLYCILIFNIYSYVTKKGNFFVFFSLLSGVFGSVSRTVYTIFILVAGLQTLRGRKWLLLFLIPALIFLFDISVNSGQNFKEPTKSVEISNNSDNTKDILGMESGTDAFYRKHTRDKAIEIWKDHVVWGAGPSMYGGALSIKYNSNLYETYKMMPLTLLFFKEWGTIDQFWPQVLAELGIIGVILFTWLFISLALMLFSFRNKTPTAEMKSLFTGFIIFLFVILIYSIAFTLNLTPILVTYFALIGIASGYVIRLS